jgi:two-component system LytT family response regulator
VTLTLKVLIVDDEPLGCERMRLALRAAKGVQVVGECHDGATAVDAIRRHSPDVVFLDVQMEGLNGFDVLERIGTNAMPVVVFVTASDAHAIRAFEVNALDYVLKPFADERLIAAIDRAHALIQERRHGALARRLADFVRDWQPPAAPERMVETDLPTQRSLPEPTHAGGAFVTRFAVRSDGRVRFVPVTDVDWIEADGNYMILHVGDVQHRLRASLAGLTSGLDPKQFVRIHRSVIVNVGRIREVQPWFGGDHIAILQTGAKLRVSRLRAAQLLRPTA